MKGQFKKQDFLSLFKKEAEMHIQELNKGLLELENNPQNRAALEEVRRRAHTLKGSARMMGFIEVSNTAHAMEDLLESVRMELAALNKGVFDKLFRNLDSINALLSLPQEDDGEKSRVVMEANAMGLHEEIENLTEVDNESASPTVRPETNAPEPRLVEVAHASVGASASASPGAVTQNAVLVRTDKLDSLAGVLSEIVLDQIKYENQATEMSRIVNLIRERVKLWSQIKDRISESSERANASANGKGRRILDAGLSSIQHPVSNIQMEEINRYDNLSVSILDDMINILDEYRGITTHRRMAVDRLQDYIRSIRLVPMSAVFDTFPRAVRDLSREYNKKIKLTISGGEVELDKSIIETIKDPLMHLIRNAVDHGIEEPEERFRRGKPEVGNISLSAYHRGSKVIIEVSDDGVGIDLEKVKQVALKKGFIKGSQLEVMDEGSAIRLIFLPGLSTSSMITDVSGRGVGMDVVMEAISRKLKGTVNVHTEAGNGTKVTLAVPITLAVMRGLMVRAGKEMFVIPTESIEKSVKIPRDQIKYVEGKRVIVEDGRIIPLARLSEVLGVDGASEANALGDVVPVVIIDHAQKQMGFCVDGFVSEQEMIIKNMGGYLKRVPNVAGVTILGSGEVVVILHISDLVISAENKFAVALPIQQPVTDHKVIRTPSILIVDDSLTTRELEKSILEASGYNVHVAVDGLDGLNKVSERRFDLIISDIQMPRMDGFQMVEKLKQSEQYKDIPVVIVTGLQKEEEKRRGIEVGASAYIVKSSFDQTTLLDTIATLIG